MERESKVGRKYTLEFGINEHEEAEPLVPLKNQKSSKIDSYQLKAVVPEATVDAVVSETKLPPPPTEIPGVEEHTVLNFPVNFDLLNLFRKPGVDYEKHLFLPQFIQKVSTILNGYSSAVKVAEGHQLPPNSSVRHLILYLHLQISMLTNLENLFTTYEAKVKAEPLAKEINSTNILNVWSIIGALDAAGDKKSQEETVSTLSVVITTNQKAFQNGRLIIDLPTLQFCLARFGRMDLHFQCLLSNVLPTSHNPALLQYCKNIVQFKELLSFKFSEVMRFYEEAKIKNPERWYSEKAVKIIDNTLNLGDVKVPVIEGIVDEQLERLLIGMLGWGDNTTEEAVRLLNSYYDNSDWQINSPFKPIISYAGKKFQINYLIEDQMGNQNDLLFLVKAPTLNPQTNIEVLSFHRPKLLKYENQEKSYLWAQLELGRFTKAGYYDWKLAKLEERGVTSVTKILNMEDFKTQLNIPESIHKPKQTRPVQGRYIVHPHNVWDLQIHEVVVDMQGSMDAQGNFSKVTKELQRYKEMGINCIYLMGAFERDNGPIMLNGKIVTYRRMNTSPLSVICRTAINSMLGGERQFLQLLKSAKKLGMKIIVDCLARVSSSRMHKKYRDLINYGLDDSGKKKIMYGTDGRAVNYEDTALLNYRKKEAWDMLLREVMQLIEKYEIDGIHLDNGQAWPQILKLDRDELFRVQSDGTRAYTDLEIFEGASVLHDEHCGYWGSAARFNYPNPFLVKLCKTIWNKHPQLLIISECWNMSNSEERSINIINSGPIPRMFKLPVGISTIFGQQLHRDGTISKIEPRNIISLKKWYQETVSVMPKGAIVVQSTTSNSWPYPAFLYRRATWAVVDLFFFLPDLPMTFIGELEGEAYKTKSTTLFASNRRDKSQNHSYTESQSLTLKTIDSKFFDQSFDFSSSTTHTQLAHNSSVREAREIPHLQESFVKEVGPEYGFNLKEIYKHYQHRRQLRSHYGVLKKGKLISVEVEHQYGFHTHVLAFVRYTSKELALVAINFNEGPVFMSFNLKSLKFLFPNYENSNIVLEIKDVFNPNQNEDNFYIISELIASKIEVKVEGYRSLLWEMVLHMDGSKLEWANKCSNRRLVKKINESPARWIYSSNLTDCLQKLLEVKPDIGTFTNHLEHLFVTVLQPNNLNLNTVISKTHEFWINKSKVFKLFGYFKKIATEYRSKVPQMMLKAIDGLIGENKLGPIAFITPEIGKWSTVGGLGVMVDELSKQLAKIGEEVIVVSPYYEYNKKGQTGYLEADGFKYNRNITVWSANIKYEIGIHTGKLNGVTYFWLHNSELFSLPYKGQDPLYVTKQLVFFALACLEGFCQMKVFPSTIVTNDWFCGFVSAYVKNGRYPEVFNGTRFMHIVHNLDPLYEGRLYPKHNDGDLGWFIQLPREWTVDPDVTKIVVNPSRCALSTCDNWGTVSHSYKYDLLKESPLSGVLWKHPNPFSFPNGVRRNERQHILKTKTPGTHELAKRQIQMKYFKCGDIDPQIPVLSFVGRVTKQKGVHLILEVVERLLYENNFKLHFLIGGPSDSREEYGKYCAQRMISLKNRYPNNVWADPNLFFEDGPLINIGSDFGMMPSLFEPGGIVQHQFFSGGTPVISFRTGGLKDTVFEYDYKTEKGNGFNFMSYNADDFKNCIQRALNCYKNQPHYEKLRRNALDSVIDVEDVAKAWNNEFHRMHNKIFVQWNMVDKEMGDIEAAKTDKVEPDDRLFRKIQGTVWNKDQDIKKSFEKVLISAQRLEAKKCQFSFHTERLPRPKEIKIAGDWDNWKKQQPLKYDTFSLTWRTTLALQPGIYLYKFIIDDAEWVVSPNDPIDIDTKGLANNKVVIE